MSVEIAKGEQEKMSWTSKYRWDASPLTAQIVIVDTAGDETAEKRYEPNLFMQLE